MASATPTTMIQQAVRPSAICDLETNPLQTFDDCVPENDIQFWTPNDNWPRMCWPNIYFGLHEGLNAQDTSTRYKYAIGIGHVLAADTHTTCALLDYCVRRGCCVSCSGDDCNKSVLQRATWLVDRQRSPTIPCFFQVLVDATFNTSKKGTVKLIHDAFGVTGHKKTSSVTNQAAELFD